MQIADTVKLHISAIPAPLIALTGYLLSPEFYNLLSPKYSKYFYVLAVITATFAPQLFKKTLPTQE